MNIDNIKNNPKALLEVLLENESELGRLYERVEHLISVRKECLRLFLKHIDNLLTKAKR